LSLRERRDRPEKFEEYFNNCLKERWVETVPIRKVGCGTTLAVFLLNCQSVARDRGGTSQQSGHHAGAPRRMGDQGKPLYVGASPEGVGWLIALDVASGYGRLFDPLGPIPLCGATSDSAARVSFTSPELSNGDIYRLRGRAFAGAVEGAVDLVAARSGRVRQSFITRLRAVRLRRQSTLGRNPVSGIYTDVVLHRATGDLLGHDLVLIDSEDTIAVLTVDYSGGPDWPRVAERAELRGDTLLLWTRYPVSGDTVDTGVIKGDTLEFGADHRMARKAGVEEFLASRSEYHCP